MKKRILTFVLSLVMILSCVVSSALVVSADDKVTATENWYTDADTLYIKNASDLLAFAAALSSNKEFEGKTVYLCNDIVLNETDDALKLIDSTAANVYNSFAGNSKAGWFAGTFDGQGYVISGLYFKGDYASAGLIPYARDNATIKNVTIKNSYFESTRSRTTSSTNSIISAVTGQYKATQNDARFTVANVHVEDTYVIGNCCVGGILGSVVETTNTGMKIAMDNVTFNGGKVKGGCESGGILGRIYNTKGYNCGVTLTMNKIVLDSTVEFIYNRTDVATFRTGGVIGYVSGFRQIDMKDIMVGGSLKNDKNGYEVSSGSALLVGELRSNDNTKTTVEGATVYSQLNISNVLTSATMENVEAYWISKKETSEGPHITMEDIYSVKPDTVTDVSSITTVKNIHSNDRCPNASDCIKTKAELQGKNSVARFDGWMVTDENSYPVPNAYPARLLGYQSSYATDVKDDNNANETYSIRLIAALNADTYTFAGFENITITYTDGNGQPVNVPKENYFCKYAYTSVIGTDKTGAEQTYTASDYGADSLIALVITGIPENVTEFTVTVKPFAGNDNGSFAGLTKTVQISAQ